VAAIVVPWSPAGAAKVPKCLGHRADIVGTEGDDVFTEIPSNGPTVIVGLGGNDTVLNSYDSGTGDVYFCGGDGNDFAHGLINRFNGGRGKDTVYYCGTSVLRSVERRNPMDCEGP
jgi:hypothetical protein